MEITHQDNYRYRNFSLIISFWEEAEVSQKVIAQWFASYTTIFLKLSLPLIQLSSQSEYNYVLQVDSSR